MCRTARPGWPVREVPLPPRVIARSLTPSQERFNDFDVVRTDRRPSSFHSSDCHSRSIPARDQVPFIDGSEKFKDRWRVCTIPIRGWESCKRRSEEHTSELQSRGHLVCRLLLEKKKTRA